MEVSEAAPSDVNSDMNAHVQMSQTKVPKSILLQIFQHFDRQTLRAASEVCKSFNELSKHPALWNNTTYSGPHSQLPELQKAIPFPPPAVLQTTLPTETTVIPAPQFSTVLPESTKIILPVLPETVPLIAQVPDVVSKTTSQGGQGEQDGSNKKEKEVVQISQLLPGYARSYAGDYVPNEVNHHSFSTFANTISFNVSRYPTPVESTDSKNYSDPNLEKENVKGENLSQGERETERAVRRVGELELNSGSGLGDNFLPGTTVCNNSNIEYVPAEYFRGVPTSHLADAVVVSKSVTNVKPEVLASGRILTHMTPIPANLNTTMSTTTESISSVQLSESINQNVHENGDHKT